MAFFYTNIFPCTENEPAITFKATLKTLSKKGKESIKKNIDVGTNDTDTFYIFIKIYICIHKKLVKHSILTVYNSQTTTKNKLLHFKSEKL